MDKNKIWGFVVFCFVGGTSALIHLLVLYLFYDFILKSFLKSDLIIFGASIYYILSYIIAMTTSVLYNFTMNRNVTFSAKHEPVRKQIPRYLVVYTISIATGFIVSLIVLNIIVENTLNALIATFFGVLLSVPISFFGSLMWTFKNPVE